MQHRPKPAWIRLQRASAVLMLALFATFQVAPPIYAQAESGISPQQQRIFDNDIQYFNYDVNKIGCGQNSAGTPANITVDKGFSLGTDDKERRVNLMKALMADFQLTPEQAAGIVGNFMWESGGKNLPPDVNQGKGPGPPLFSGGYGWAQWTGSRQVTFIDFAIAGGYMGSKSEHATDAANYAYLKNELTTTYKSTIPELKKFNTTDETTASFEATFEAAGKPAIANRQAFAREVLAEYNGGGAGGSTGSTGATSGSACSTGGAAIVGDVAFPLKTTKSVVSAKNPGMFHDGNTEKGGHPYTAFDILADPGTEVVAFMSGTVTLLTTDKCPGQMISIYNEQSDLTISYLHMDFGNHVNVGDTVTPGQHVGMVGPPANGCGIPHLHIDAAQGKTRPGCARENCPPANASKFVDIGPQLFTTYEALPE